MRRVKNITMAVLVIVISTGWAMAQEVSTSEMEASKKIPESIQVVPEFDNNPNDEMYRLPTGEGDSLEIYPAKMNGKVVGYAVNTYTTKGFGGNITLMTGFKSDGTIVNISVLEHKETPGLGTKMTDTDFSGQFTGKNPADYILKVKKDGGDIDQLTGATISPRAVSGAVEKGLVWFRANKDTILDASAGSAPAQTTGEAS